MKKEIPLKHWCQICSLVLLLNLQVLEDQSLSVIEKEQIESLRKLGFSWVKIAGLLHVGISESTLHRRRQELSLNDD